LYSLPEQNYVQYRCLERRLIVLFVVVSSKRSSDNLTRDVARFQFPEDWAMSTCGSKGTGNSCACPPARLPIHFSRIGGRSGRHYPLSRPTFSVCQVTLLWITLVVFR